MYYFLEKMLQKFLWPESLALIALVLVFFALIRRKIGMATKLLVVGFILLAVPSVPIVSSTLLGHLERYYPAKPLAQYPEADVIVVLGGSTAAVQPPRQEPEEIYGSRLLPAARLYKLGKAKHVMVCGGIPYTDTHGQLRTMADDMRDILVEEGVPASAILLENISRTTREDAFYAGQMLEANEFKSVLLVTSAFHLRRATDLFRRTGLEIIPVPVGHEVTGTRPMWEGFFPDSHYLWLSSVAWKEYVGRWVDQIH
jgi:uncharacterized SAM-binding protein YcdF (DUF218 family)